MSLRFDQRLVSSPVTSRTRLAARSLVVARQPIRDWSALQQGAMAARY
jgi:hypothetical protein